MSLAPWMVSMQGALPASAPVGITGRTRTLLVVLLVLSVAGGCGWQGADWSEEDIRMVYAAAIEAIYEELDHPEEFIIDPRARFLVDGGEGFLEVGEFNEYGDPTFEAAIAAALMAVECRVVRDGVCQPGEGGQYATISDVGSLNSDRFPL